VGIPDEDRIPYRHSYGNFTHYSGNGQYRFEWTPITPAIDAWRRAEASLKRALDRLADAQKLPGFALNGLSEEHAQMIATLKVLAQDTQVCHAEAGKVVQVLEVANTDYANAHEASLEEYKALTHLIDVGKGGRQRVRDFQDDRERGEDAQRDKDVFPFDGER